MSVKTRNQTRSQSSNQWQAKLPAQIHKPEPCQVVTLPVPEPSPIITYPIFCQRLDIIFDKIEDIEILRSKSLPDTSLNRTLRFERIRIMSELFFFIYIYFPTVYIDSHEHNNVARIFINSIIKLKNELPNIKSLDNLTPLESSTINTIETALISCTKILDFYSASLSDSL